MYCCHGSKWQWLLLPSAGLSLGCLLGNSGNKQGASAETQPGCGGSSHHQVAIGQWDVFLYHLDITKLPRILKPLRKTVLCRSGVWLVLGQNLSLEESKPGANMLLTPQAPPENTSAFILGLGSVWWEPKRMRWRTRSENDDAEGEGENAEEDVAVTILPSPLTEYSMCQAQRAMLHTHCPS